jgi:hypothetical protein
LAAAHGSGRAIVLHCKHVHSFIGGRRNALTGRGSHRGELRESVRPITSRARKLSYVALAGHRQGNCTMIAELIFLIVIVALALPGLIVHAFDYGERTEPTPVVTSPPALQS